MVTQQNVIRAFVLALTLVLIQGCSSLELAVDLYKKQKREDMAKALASMTDEERKKFMAEVRSRRVDSEETAAI